MYEQLEARKRLRATVLRAGQSRVLTVTDSNSPTA